MKRILDILITSTLIAGMMLIATGCNNTNGQSQKFIPIEQATTNPAIIADAEEKRAADLAAHPPKQYHQCGAKTRKGTPCTRKVSGLTGHCFQHKDAKPARTQKASATTEPATVNQNMIVEKAADAEEPKGDFQCSGVTKKGAACSRSVTTAGALCFQHKKSTAEDNK